MRLPPPTLTTNDQSSAVILHLSPLLGFILPSLGHLLGPAIAWFALKDRSAALDDQGKEVLNFQLSITLYHFLALCAMLTLAGLGLLGSLAQGGTDGGGLFTLGLLSGVFGIYLPVALAFSIVPFVLMIIAAVKAGNSQGYRYPMTIRFLK